MGTLFQKQFSEIIGKPCWGRHYDSQTGLHLNFGNPQLEIREPYKSNSKDVVLRERAQYRSITVKGTSWLWIFCSFWKLTLKDAMTVRSSFSYRMIQIATARLDGQILLDVKVHPATGSTIFKFDIGAVLECRRFDKQSTEPLWLLGKSDGHCLSVTGDGYYILQKGSKPGGKRIRIPNYEF